jgi:hypothetical protein
MDERHMRRVEQPIRSRDTLICHVKADPQHRIREATEGVSETHVEIEYRL